MWISEKDYKTLIDERNYYQRENEYKAQRLRALNKKLEFLLNKKPQQNKYKAFIKAKSGCVTIIDNIMAKDVQEAEKQIWKFLSDDPLTLVDIQKMILTIKEEE